MTGQFLGVAWRSANQGEIRDERVSIAVKVGIAALGIDVLQEVALPAVAFFHRDLRLA